MATSSIRVLVAEDFEPFRKFLSKTLQNRPELQIICEVADGLQAVQKAEVLQPDLVLLDIGLPNLNGIEVARQVSKLCPRSKVIFVTQESSQELVQGALAAGATGYVVKVDAGSQLLIAMDAVLRGEVFVSRSAGGDLRRASNDKGFKKTERQKVFALQPPRKAGISNRHEVEFYSDEASFLDGFTGFIGGALNGGHSVAVVTTEAHRDTFPARLQAYGCDIVAAIEEGRYTCLDAADVLSSFMVNNMPDPVRFAKSAENLIREVAKAAKRESSRIVLCGECAPLLWAQGKPEAAIRLEQLWNEIAIKHDVDIRCGYPLGSFQGGVGSHIFGRICAEHSAVHTR